MDVGVIGVGAMGKNHVRVYSELKGVDTVYVYDPIPENAQRAHGDNERMNPEGHD